MSNLSSLLNEMEQYIDGQYGTDFLQTWDKNDNAIQATQILARFLKEAFRENVSPKIFDSGLGIAIFKDQSTRTRYSFNGAANLLGLDPIELDLGKSQIAHGETTVETINMLAFLTRIIGIRDDIYLGVGHEYMLDVVRSLELGVKENVIPHRPSVINCQSDTDHPTQSMADLVHLIEYFGGVENLKGKKIAMSWAYSPSYGKPLSVPQGIIGLMSRFGMDMTLAYPEGYNLIPEIEQKAAAYSKASGGNFTITHSMDEAFKDADVVYPKSWASFEIMEERTQVLASGNKNAYEDLEKKALAQNALHTEGWECNEENMKLTKDGKALYMHCLPADITGESCKQGEVAQSVFARYRPDTYREASNKPFSIAAMSILCQYKNPMPVLKALLENKKPILA